MLERIKKILNINDSLQDEVLNILISNVSSHLLALIDNDQIDVIPDGLNHVVEEITVRRYNRLSSEGFKSESVEGHSVTFYDLNEEFTPYLSIILNYNDPPTKSGRGRVFFI